MLNRYNEKTEGYRDERQMINRYGTTMRIVGSTLCFFSTVLMIATIRTNDSSAFSRLSSSALAGIVGAAGILMLTAKE